jgi:dephospho-CoA kinase
MGKVIILTGAPATGKSTLAKALQKRVFGLECVKM